VKNTDLRGKNLLVTGANGRIGRLLRHLWADFDVVWSGRKADFVWDMGADPAPRLPEGMTILHLAGAVGGDLQQNIRAAQGLARALVPGHRVILVSSIAVYGAGAGPFCETDALAPASDYARAKAEVEAILAPFDPLILRLGNLFGADALTRALAEGPVSLDATPEGRGPLRSWIGPLSLGRALWALRDALPRIANPGIVNLAQGPALPMADLVEAMGGTWTLGPRPAPVPRAELDLARLDRLCPLPEASAKGLVAELGSLKGIWP
jgi:nucleoside-diphosphate-sugar epimerase